MSNKDVVSAATIPAPIAADADVLVVPISTSATGAVDVYGADAGEPIWYRVKACLASGSTDTLHMTIGDANVATPDPTAVTGSDRSIELDAREARQWQFDATRRYVNAIGVAGDSDGSGFLRLEKAGIDFNG